MAKNLLNKYVWLVETIHKAGHISFEDINRRWLDNDMSEDKPLPLRTFHKWCAPIRRTLIVSLQHETVIHFKNSIIVAKPQKLFFLLEFLS